MIAFAARFMQAVSSTYMGGLPGLAQTARLLVCIAALTTPGSPVTRSRRTASCLHIAAKLSMDGRSIIERPSMESFAAMCKHEAVRLLLVTGEPGVVKAAMQTSKRAVCARPGNPPIYVDDTACMKRAAKAIIQGASYDNNLLCI